MPRIVYVWDADYPWDVRTEKTCAALTAAGHDVHLVARNRGWRPTLERLPEATVHRMPPWRMLGQRIDGLLGFPAYFSPRWTSLLSKVVNDVRPDAIIARDLPLCPTALQVAAPRGIPVIFDMAEHYPAMMRAIFESGRQKPVDYVVRNPRMVSRVEQRCLRNVDRVLVVIEEAIDRLVADGVNADRIHVVGNTPERARAASSQARPGKGETEPLDIVHLGVLEIPRGVMELVESLAILRDRGVNVRLRLIGDGRDRALFEQRARELELGPDRVEFLGFVSDRKDVLRMVAEADIGAVPQRVSEASDSIIPNKIFDYMAAGLPVLSADSRPCARVMRETGAGVVHRSGDAASIADAIMTLRDPALRERCGEAGRRAILERFHWERDAAELLRAVELSVTRESRTQGAA